MTDTRLRDLELAPRKSFRLIATSREPLLWLGWRDDKIDPLPLEPAGVRMLAAYLLAARLALPARQPDEALPGSAPVHCSLALLPAPHILLGAGEERLQIPDALWNRLYAELLLLLAWWDGADAGLTAHRAAVSRAWSQHSALH